MSSSGLIMTPQRYLVVFACPDRRSDEGKGINCVPGTKRIIDDFLSEAEAKQVKAPECKIHGKMKLQKVVYLGPVREFVNPGDE